MKKLLLASAVAALSITAAQAAPTVYGKVFLTLDVADGDDNSSFKDSRTQLNSNASRLGVKGSEALTSNTDLIYQLEYRLDTDADGQRNWESRDTYLGLSNKQYGTLVAGRLTAIDDYINYANVTKGGVIGGDDVQASFKSQRANNAFAYFSPDYNGMQFMGMYALDENNSSDNLKGDAFGAGVKYEPTNAPYKAGVTYIRASNGGAVKAGTVGDFGALQAIRVSGAYALNPALTLAAQYQNTDRDTDNNENAFTVSGKYKVAQTPWTAYGQVDWVDNLLGVENAERQRLALGGEYSFNKNTSGHVYGAYLRDDDGADKVDAYGIGAGIEYKF